MRGNLMEIDWTEIILDLRRSGMRQHEIAREMGKAASEALIRQYLAGVSPLHWRGEMLLGLWEERTGKRRERAPRRPADIRRPGPRKKHQHQTHFPNEHAQALASFYGISVAKLLGALRKKEKREMCAPVNLTLPGFEE